MTDSIGPQVLPSPTASRLSPIDVAVIEPVGAHGGMEFYNHQLCESLTDAGCRVSLYTSAGYPSEQRRHRLVESFAGVFGKEAKWRRGLRFVGGALRTFISARFHGAKLAHFHIFSVSALEYMNVLLARAVGMRVVVTAHDVGSFRAGENKRLLRKLYRHSAAVIAHSQTARRALIQGLGVDPRCVHYIPLGNFAGLLSEFPDKAVVRAQLGLAADEFVVLFFGQCKKVKRLDLLVEAVARARERGARRIRLLIAGTMADSDAEALAAQIQSRLGDAAIHHARYIPNSEMPLYFAAADVIALPYDQIFQSGVVVLAMTYGLPVLTSDIEGMVEIVHHRHTGLNFRAGDIDNLTERLLEIERGDWPLAEYASAARAHVLSNHAWDRCGQLTAAVHQKVLHV